ncbi:hypothetical protein BPAE_0054g00060 [Botrytis paeoniae]|uniref:Uncharacterized protein n=1 Tax=Botrytis paeoniae TaxID=278948 RepID=A0A4Z1FSS9_9HELO|nr:hypothetical protein BPAE_0054g00060 [Botrytis paeoniae]
MSQLRNKTVGFYGRGSQMVHASFTFDANRGYSDQRVTALHMACGSGFERIAKVLIEHGANIELEVEVGDTNNFRVGFDKKKTIFAPRSRNPLQMAAYTRNFGMLELNPTIQIFMCLEVVEEILNFGAKIFENEGK